jgi:PAT family beta-lactamase induction signal transducer AmpG
MAVTRYVTGAPTGYLVSAAGWPLFFVVCTAAALPGLLLILTYERWGAAPRTEGG